MSVSSRRGSATSSCSGVKVRVLDSALGAADDPGWYTDRSLEAVLTLVCGAFQATCSIRQGTATIGG